MKKYGVVIIGSGVIGSALARALLLTKKNSCAVLEKESGPAQHTSGRNSGVIHSGFNPKPGTLKARLCVCGNRDLKSFCSKKNIPFQETGTLVVASKKSDFSVLNELLHRGQSNNVPNIQMIDESQLKKLEPHVSGLGALYSPSGAITSGKKVTMALVEEAQQLGADFYFDAKVTAIELNDSHITVFTKHGKILAETMVNCAGLYADKIAAMTGHGRNVTIVPFRGDYFKIHDSKNKIINSMVYPTPNIEMPFLGVHWTKTIEGDVIIGPNASLALGRESYRSWDINFIESVDMVTRSSFWNMWSRPQMKSIIWEQLKISLSRTAFVEQARLLVPDIKETDFSAGKSGIRPQMIDQKGHLIEDILIEQDTRVLHVLNAVSPGFTCAIPFADHLVKLIN